MTTALTLNDGARGLATPGATPAAPRRIEIPPTPMPRVRGLVLSGLAFAGVFVFGAGAWSVLAPL
jgi:HlyD family secretion protein